MTTALFFLVLAIVSRVDGKKLTQANKRTQKRISEKKVLYIYDLMSVNRCKKNLRNVFLFFIKTRKSEKKSAEWKLRTWTCSVTVKKEKKIYRERAKLINKKFNRQTIEAIVKTEKYIIFEWENSCENQCHIKNSVVFDRAYTRVTQQGSQRKRC